MFYFRSTLWPEIQRLQSTESTSPRSKSERPLLGKADIKIQFSKYFLSFEIPGETLSLKINAGIAGFPKTVFDHGLFK